MRTRLFAAFAFLATAFLVAPAFADGSFVKIGAIKGTATEAQHQGWTQIGTWGTETRSVKWFWSSPRQVFWFEMAGDHTALEKALADKTFYDRVLFDVSIKGEILRTTFTAVRVESVDHQNKIVKVTLQFKKQTDQQITLTAAR